MKLRKHINNKRVEKIEQMGVDRVLGKLKNKGYKRYLYESLKEGGGDD